MTDLSNLSFFGLKSEPLPKTIGLARFRKLIRIWMNFPRFVKKG